MGRSEDFIESAFSEEERQELLKSNKYYNLNNDFDPADVLQGNIPEFKSQGDKFRCVMAIANFVKGRDSIDGIAEGLANFLNTLDIDMVLLFVKQQEHTVLCDMIESDLFINTIRQAVNTAI